MKEVDKIITLYVTLQSVIHQIDDISEVSYFRQEFKQRTLSYLKYLENFIKPLDKGMDKEEAEQYVHLVKELDNFISDLVTQVILEK